MPRIPWNKGKTKENDPLLTDISKKVSATRKAKSIPSWAKGKTKETDSRLVKLSETLKIKGIRPPKLSSEAEQARREKIRAAKLGKPRSESTKLKISAKLTGRKASPESRRNQSLAQLGRVCKPEDVERRRQSHIATIKSRNSEIVSKRFETNMEKYGRPFPVKDTKPELIVKAELDRMGIRYLHQNPVAGFISDFYVPVSKTVVEVDGCYFHACISCNKVDPASAIDAHHRDALKDNVWLDRDYKIIRIAEHEVLAGDFSKLNVLQEQI